MAGKRMTYSVSLGEVDIILSDSPRLSDEGAPTGSVAANPTEPQLGPGRKPAGRSRHTSRVALDPEHLTPSEVQNQEPDVARG